MQKGVDKVKACEKRYEELQHEVVQQALGVFLTYSSLLLAVGDILAVVDVLAALSHIAISNNWTTPTILPANDQMVGTEIHITGLRHPILEDQLGAMGVVANDVDISPPRRLMLVTGPNMGGKSTYLRATGICILLAQMGSMVPAQSVTMTLFDRLFIRSGATDCTSMNQSTFMVEMLEMSKILRDATSSSLVLLDEVGRGTSTNDGFGIAYALLRHLAEETGCITLCATHFHELSQLCAESDRYYACHVVATMQEGQRDDVTMLYQVRPGQSADSLGIAVARLAEFPENIIANALALEESWKEQEAHGMTTSTMAAITGMKRSIEEGGCCG